MPTGLVDYSRRQAIRCVHGDSHAYLTADLTVVVDKQPYLLTVGVVDKLHVPAILGWDLPVLLEVLLKSKDIDSNAALSGQVLTRAQAKAEVAHNSRSGEEPEPEPAPFSNLDSSLFEGGTKGPRKSCRQCQFEKGLTSRLPDRRKELFGSSFGHWCPPTGG